MSLNWDDSDLELALKFLVIILVIAILPDLSWWQYLLLGVSYPIYALIGTKRKENRT